MRRRPTATIGAPTSQEVLAIFAGGNLYLKVPTDMTARILARPSFSRDLGVRYRLPEDSRQTCPDHRGDHSSREIDLIVIEPVAPFEPSAEHTVGEHPADARSGCDPEPTGGDQSARHAHQTHQEGPADSEQRPYDRDAAIGPSRYRFACRDQPRGLAESLATLA